MSNQPAGSSHKSYDGVLAFFKQFHEQQQDSAATAGSISSSNGGFPVHTQLAQYSQPSIAAWTSSQPSGGSSADELIAEAAAAPAKMEAIYGANNCGPLLHVATVSSVLSLASSLADLGWVEKRWLPAARNSSWQDLSAVKVACDSKLLWCVMVPQKLHSLLKVVPGEAMLCYWGQQLVYLYLHVLLSKQPGAEVEWPNGHRESGWAYDVSYMDQKVVVQTSDCPGARAVELSAKEQALAAKEGANYTIAHVCCPSATPWLPGSGAVTITFMADVQGLMDRRVIRLSKEDCLLHF